MNVADPHGVLQEREFLWRRIRELITRFSSAHPEIVLSVLWRPDFRTHPQRPEGDGPSHPQISLTDRSWYLLSHDASAVEIREDESLSYSPIAEEYLGAEYSIPGHPALLGARRPTDEVLSLPLCTRRGALMGILVASPASATSALPLHTDPAIMLLRTELAAILSEEHLESALERRRSFDQLLAAAVVRFVDITTETLDVAVSRTVEEIGAAVGADRAYLFLVDRPGSTVSNTHEWCRPGIESLKPANQKLSLANFPWLVSKLLGQEIIQLRSIDDFPEIAIRERKAFIRGGRASLIAVPLSSSTRVLGFLGLDAVATPRSWSVEVVSLLKVFGHLIGTAYERCRSQEEIARNREQLTQSEAQLRLTFDTARIGMATATVDGRLLSINNALSAMTGFSEGELRERPWVSLLLAEEQIHAQCALGELVRGERTRIELESRFVCEDGSLLEVLQHVGVVADSQGRPLSLLIEVEDLTERKRVEEELIRASKFESLGVLAGGIAHDFNNVLMAVMGSVSVCLSRIEPDNEITVRLKDVERAILRARDLTRRLLTFAKGGAPIRMPASLLDILRDTVGFSLTGTGTCFELEAPENLWAVQVDSGQIAQVINNLVLNSSQAMPEGGMVSVSCSNYHLPRGSSETLASALSPGRYVRVKISDHGCGIKPDHLTKIFDPFFSTKETGTGLGLATVYSIIKRHGGHIEVESTVGSGTTFYIYLPASRGPVATPLREQIEIEPGHGRILLVDDEDLVRRTAESMLTHLGYSVESVEDGMRAIELYRKAMQEGEPFDAVIMDLTIPGGLGGDAAIRKLRRLDPTVRAIVSSGYADGPVMADYRKYGFQGVMAKPYELRQLSAVLRTVLSVKM